MNKFKQRNFDSHHLNYRPYDVSSQIASDLVVSNSQYDRSRFVTHAFIPDGSGGFRYCSALDLAFSTSPQIASYVPSDLRSKLQSLVVSPPSIPSPLSDDDLLRSVPSNFGLERSEIADLSRLNSSFIPTETASTETTSTEDTSTEDTSS